MSYSNKTHVILIEGEVRTTEVSLVRADPSSGNNERCLVYYKRARELGKGRLYQYPSRNVIVLKNPKVLNPKTYDIYFHDKLLDNVFIICHFQDAGLNYWTIGFQDSREDIVCQDAEISLKEKLPHCAPSSSIVEYMTQMAYLHGYDIRTNDGVVLLGDQYDHLRRNREAPLLGAYLNPRGFKIASQLIPETILFPFYTNASQMNAISAALSNRISVIQGPPGTGKTETILNILLNLVLRRRSVLVVAGSNSAMDNVVEKLQDDGLDFLVARLGRKNNKESFVGSQKVDNLCPSEWGMTEREASIAFSKVYELSAELKRLFVLDREMHAAIEKGNATKAAELKERLSELHYAEKRDKLKNLSVSLVKHLLQKRFGRSYCRQTYTLDDLGVTSTRFDSFLKDYPIVLSTAFSATKCVASSSIYDYVVMDEASQISVITGALAFSIARNAVIVGDCKQLPNVIKEEMRAVSQSVFQFFRIPEEYNYATHNFLQSVCEVFPDAPETLLREHYRCHPKIVRFFNNEFYGGQLVAMTEDHGEEDVLVLRTTVPGNHAADFTNHREEEEIEDLKRDYGIDGEDEEVGIITPYNNQVRRIDDDEDIEEDIMVSTVHKFQGRQKDIIIISTVDNEYTRFGNDPNLLNVAVSRAKKQLILVTNGNDNNSGTVQHLVDYIKASGERCEKGKVTSLFDLIYPQYEAQFDEFVKAHPRIDKNEYEGQDSPTPVEIIAHGFISDVIKEFPNLTVKFRYPLSKLIKDTSRLEDEEEVRFVKNKDSHIDFMIFEKETMKPFLAIEIDGASYHIEGSFQGQRDELKDGILEKYGIPMKRFRTKESVNEYNALKVLFVQYY